jgi:N-acetylglutamate synthase-like GNAT family acetyltransferase
MKKDLQIRFAEERDWDQLVHADWFSDHEKLHEKIARQEIIVCDEPGQITGLLRYSWFWGYLPFIDLIWVEEGFRREGRATCLLARLEEVTNEKNHNMIFTSTQSNENGQLFFRKTGFIDSGGFVIRGEPFELFMIKYL